MNKMNSELLGIPIPAYTRNETLQKIKEILNESSYAHVVSLNPEILVMTTHDEEFKKIVFEARVKIIDGIGVEWAGKMLNMQIGERYPGVNLMDDLIQYANEKKLRVLILGGAHSVSSQLAHHLEKKYPQATFKGVHGYKDVTSPKPEEELDLFSLIKLYNPHLVFIAFGAPKQEKWIYSHRNELQHAVCVSVGGAVDYLAGAVPRAPQYMQKMGLEWLFRLIVQPWRWRRQLRLIEFIFLVLSQKFHQ